MADEDAFAPSAIYPLGTIAAGFGIEGLNALANDKLLGKAKYIASRGLEKIAPVFSGSEMYDAGQAYNLWIDSDGRYRTARGAHGGEFAPKINAMSKAPVNAVIRGIGGALSGAAMLSPIYDRVAIDSKLAEQAVRNNDIGYMQSQVGLGDPDAGADPEDISDIIARRYGYTPTEPVLNEGMVADLDKDPWREDNERVRPPLPNAVAKAAPKSTPKKVKATASKKVQQPSDPLIVTDAKTGEIKRDFFGYPVRSADPRDHLHDWGLTPEQAEEQYKMYAN